MQPVSEQEIRAMVAEEFARPTVIRLDDLESAEVENVEDEYGRMILRITLPLDHPVARAIRAGDSTDGLSIRFPGTPSWTGRIAEVVTIPREAVDGPPPGPSFGELAHRAHLAAYERMLAAEYGIDRREARP